MHNIDLLFCSWKTFDVKFGRYLDPFSISIDIRRSQRSRYGSYFAIDSVRLHNCEPGTYQEITMLNFPEICKGQLNSEWIYEVIVSLKMPTKNCQDFCPGSFLEGRAKISVIFGWHFGRNDDLINSFWI